MKCPDCGFDNPDSVIFCDNCRKRIVLAAGTYVQDEESYFEYKWAGVKYSQSKDSFVFFSYLFGPIFTIAGGLFLILAGNLVGLAAFTYLGLLFIAFAAINVIAMKAIRDLKYGMGSMLLIGIAEGLFGSLLLWLTLFPR